MTDYRVRGVSVYSQAETKVDTNDKRKPSNFATSSFLALGNFQKDGPNNVVTFLPDPSSMFAPNDHKFILTGYSLADGTIPEVALKGTRPKVISTKVTNNVPAVAAGGTYIYQSGTAGTYTIVKTATGFTINSTAYNVPNVKEFFLELLGAGSGGSSAGATSLGNRGNGGAGGAWALLRIRLDIGMTMTVVVGLGGAGSTSTNGTKGGASKVTISTESYTCDSGTPGQWGGWGDAQPGGVPSGTTSGTYIKEVAKANGANGGSNADATSAISISTNDGTPEVNPVERGCDSSNGASGGSGGGGSAMGKGGDASNGKAGGSGSGYGAGGAGGGRDGSFSRKKGGSGTNGWFGLWY